MFKKLPDQKEMIYDLFTKHENVLLIVLDACNWKIMSSLRPRWPLQIVRSRGSNTSDWLDRTFVQPLSDVVYVSSNPFTYVLKNVRKKFKRVSDLYLMAWDKKLQTVRPRVVNLFVKQKLVSGETKIIAHYMQPHAPFLTKTWLNNYKEDLDFKKIRTPAIYDIARRSPFARAEFRKAYMKNFEIVTTYAESLVKYVKNLNANFKIVITSDHSEVLKGLYHPLRDKRRILVWIGWVLGIYRFVGHESKSRFRRLYEVPWVVF